MMTYKLYHELTNLQNLNSSAEGIQILLIGIGIIIEGAFGATLVGLGCWWMVSVFGGNPKGPNKSLIEKIKKALREHKIEVAASCSTLVLGIALLIHTGYHLRNGTEPDYQWVYDWILHRTKFDPTQHGIGNSKLKPFEDHLLSTLEYCSRPEVENNPLLKLSRYITFDPAKLDPSQWSTYIEIYNTEITTGIHTVGFDQFLAHSPFNEKFLLRHIDFLIEHPDMCGAYERRFIGFVQDWFVNRP